MTPLLWAAAGLAVVAAAAFVIRRGRREPALQLAGERSFSAAARRTTLLWCSLAAALVALLALFAVRAGAQTTRPPILRAGTDAIVVVDLSGSALPASKGIASVLLTLTRDPHRHLGLVVFSDTAYEALPPSAPVEGLKGWLELFASGRPWNYPWSGSFASGTTISSGLVLARQLLRRSHARHPHVVLVSDLSDSESDLQRLETVTAQYQRERIDLTVVKVQPGVEATPSAAGLPNADFLATAADRTIAPTTSTTSDAVPAVLAALVAVLGLLAAVNELALHPLTWKAGT